MNDLDTIKSEIRARVSLIDLAREAVSLHRRGAWWVGLCPFHSEKTPSFHVSDERGFFKCFGCGRGGDVFTFVQLRENVEFGEALRMLADRAGVEMRRSGGGGDTRGTGRADLARICSWALGFFRRELAHASRGAAARRYLAARGVNDEAVARFDLGYAAGNLEALLAEARSAGLTVESLQAGDVIRSGDQGGLYCTFRNRVMFPIHDAMTRVVGFGGRTLADDPAKYLNTRQNALFDKRGVLYGIHLARARIAERDRSVLVEGYLDCIAAHQAGVTETVATLGTALTETHVRVLRRYGGTAVVLFDADKAGEAAAERAIRLALPCHLTVRLARIPDGKDPAEYLQLHDGDSFNHLLNSADDALEFKWRRTRERFGADLDGRHRREAIEDYLRVVGEAVHAGAIPEIDRGLVVDPIARLLGLRPEEVDRLLRRFSPRRATTRSADGAPPGTGSDPRRDAEQERLTQVLEVLVHEPGLFDSCRAWFDPARFRDARDRRIAVAVHRLADVLGEFDIPELLAECEDPDLAARVTELVVRGQARGDVTGLIQAARRQLEEIEADHRIDEARTVTLSYEADPGVSQAKRRDQLLDDLRKPAGFRPRRKSGTSRVDHTHS